MYINLTIFFKAEYITFFERPFSLRRWLFVILFTGLFWIMWLLVAVGRLLDHLFFPRFREQVIREPIFIISPPRSGTTFLHELLCLDEERFAYLKLYQTIFPSLIFERLFEVFGWIDRHGGRMVSRFAGWVRERLFRGWAEIHPLAFDKPEADEGFFVYSLMTDMIHLLFPYFGELGTPAFADKLAKTDRAKLMRYYKGCLQRRLYASGPTKIFLSKDSQFLGRIECILETFPDARIITLVRHPDETVPSYLSLFHRAWRVHSPEIAKDSPETRALAQLLVDWHLHFLKNRGAIDERRYLSLPYAKLVENPKRTVEAIYRYFGLEMSERFQVRLAAAAERSREYRSKHVYALEEYGLDKQWIRDRLGDFISACGMGAANGNLGPSARDDATDAPE